MEVQVGTAKASGGVSAWLLNGGFVLAVICLAALLLSGVGYRFGLWHFRTGFLIIRCAFWGAVAAAALTLLGLLIPAPRAPRSMTLGAIGFVLAAITVYIPWSWKQTLDSLPYIHDITTDLKNPPSFIAVKGRRKEGEHTVDYDGPEVAAQQAKAYPDLAPLVTTQPPARVFEAAKAVIGKMGMEVVDANPQEGRIEATATSRFYGFKDDMVVRITPQADGTHVDVRSKSRVGRSDLGQNAKRIRQFMSELGAAIKQTG
jgi:uncharacterized protein (DUF1499 family)